MHYLQGTFKEPLEDCGLFILLRGGTCFGRGHGEMAEARRYCGRDHRG